jgi:hypothetical protein
MNKYSSGYTSIALISVFGWIVIAVSVVGGVIVLANAPPDIGYVGWIIVVAGGVQGLILLGMGAIGLSILEGSVAQQDSLKVLIDIRRAVSDENFEVEEVKLELDKIIAQEISQENILKKEEIQGISGRIYDLYFMLNNKIRVKKGAGFLEFETIEEAKKYFETNR